MMTRIFVFGMSLLIMIGYSCTNAGKYEADWIVTDIRYNEVSIMEYLRLGNLTINFQEGQGFTSGIDYLHFKDETINYPVSFKLEEKEGKDLLIIEGSKFFTDTFEIKCLTKKCCEISLITDSKYVRLIFNNELAGRKRRNCPSSMSVLEELGWFRHRY